MAEGVLLTVEEARLFREITRFYKDNRSELISRKHTGQHFGENEDHQAPEVYVAKPPAGGIPPLQVVIGAPDRPGEAECEIFKLGYRSTFTPTVTGTGTGSGTTTVNVEGGQKVLLRADIPDQLVCNLSLVAINEPYVLIHRDKYGTWYVDCPCPTGVIPPTGTGTGTTGTGTTGTGTVGSGTTGTGSDSMSCCEQLPNTLNVEIWLEETGPDPPPGTRCDTRTITVTKVADYRWEGSVTNWCTSPATFPVVVTCIGGVMGITLDGNSAGSGTCSIPLDFTGCSTAVTDSSCCSSSPGDICARVTS